MKCNCSGDDIWQLIAMNYFRNSLFLLSQYVIQTWADKLHTCAQYNYTNRPSFMKLLDQTSLNILYVDIYFVFQGQNSEFKKQTNNREDG